MNKTIWIDLDNSPHVPFFLPIIAELKRRGFPVRITVRDCSQTCALADLHRLAYAKVGRHYGKRTPVKAAATVVRSLQLILSLLRGERPALAISHGSRAQMLSALLLGLPSLVIMDYEHVSGFIRPTWVMMPELIPGDSLTFDPKRILRYCGIKEDVYVPLFRPDSLFRTALGIREDDILVTIRPPATEAHYHNAESESLFAAAVNRLEGMDTVRMVILPRYKRQKTMIRAAWPGPVAARKIIIPEHVVGGLDLLWHSDLVISGGGTMNREAAALGVPVYSIFRGRIGAVDRWLAKQGRLVLIETVDDVRSKIAVVKRDGNGLPVSASSRTLTDIIGHIESVVGPAPQPAS